MQSKESSDANSELFKEDDDEAMYKNPYEIRLCYLISVSLILYPIKKAVARELGIGVLIGSGTPYTEGDRPPICMLLTHFQ